MWIPVAVMRTAPVEGLFECFTPEFKILSQENDEVIDATWKPVVRETSLDEPTPAGTLASTLVSDSHIE